MLIADMQGLINLMITLILTSSFILLGTRRLDSAVRIVIGQALLLTIFSLLLELMTGIREMFFAAFLTFTVKAVGIPYILKRVVSTVHGPREAKSYVGFKASFLAGGVLIVISYLAAGQIMGHSSGLLSGALPAAIAMMLIGLFVMMTRKLAVMQIVGLLLMENGLYLAGVGTTTGMPLVIELGIFIDVLIGALIMAVLVFRINRTFSNISTENLRNLKG